MQPLILITRPEAAAIAFAEELRAAIQPDLRICVAPLLAIKPLDPPQNLARFGTLICTSAHAVTQVTQQDMRPDVTCFAVGDATARAMRDNGFHPIIGPGTARALARQIISNPPPSPCLYLRGEHVAFDLAKALETAGIETHSAITYQQEPQPLAPDARALIQTAGSVIAPVFSPRSARLLLEAVGQLPDLRIATISPAVAQVIPNGLATHIAIAKTPERQAMLNCVAALARDAHSA